MGTSGIRSAGSLRAVAAIVVCLSVALAGAGPASAAPGDVDTGFAGDGKMAIPGQMDAASQFVDGAGRTWVSGSTRSGDGVVVARVRPNGTLDPSFSDDGRVVIGIGGGSSEAFVSGRALIAPRPGGRAVVAIPVMSFSFTSDDFDMTSEIRLFGLGSGGRIDRSFGSNGRVRLNEGNSFFSTLIALDTRPDGSIRLARVGDRPNGTLATSIYHLEPDGTADTSFSGDGRVVGPGVDAVDGAFLPDGRLLVVFPSMSNGTDQRLRIGRLRAYGAWDPTFSEDGRATVADKFLSIYSFMYGAVDVALGGHGRALVAYRAPTGVVGLVRMTVDGDRDPTFSGNGRVPIDAPRAEGVAVVADASFRPIVATWQWDVAGVAGDLVVRRFTGSGTPDAGFSGDGVASVSAGTDGAVWSMSEADGKITVGGTTAPPGGDLRDLRSTVFRFLG